MTTVGTTPLQSQVPQNMKPMRLPRFATPLTVLASALLVLSPGCSPKTPGGGHLSAGVRLDSSNLAEFQQRTALAVTSAPPSLMKGNGLAGVAGGAHVKLLKAGTQELLLPMPQLADTQIPLVYTITTTPVEVCKEHRLCRREGSNAVVNVQLRGKPGQEVQINWSAVVLIASRSAPPSLMNPDSLLPATACVQAGAKEVQALAGRLWPPNGAGSAYAASIQAFIRGMKQRTQPRAMDALAILGSGANWICTANANLAVALLRTKNIPARSLATIPTVGRRLEMHRIVEFAERGQWQQFDPSSVQTDIPMKPWQNIIMAWTSVEDEDCAMSPRMGSALGCPYGQEIEFLDSGITLWGQDFFWTMGVALAEFDAGDEAVGLARAAWSRFLETGSLSQSQIRAASTTNATALLEALRAQ